MPELPEQLSRWLVSIGQPQAEPSVLHGHALRGLVVECDVSPEGLNSFIPGSGQGVGFAPRPNAYRQPGFVFPDLAWQSCFGGAFGAAGRLQEWPAAMRDQARKR